MTSISSVNSAALLILQQASASKGANQASDSGTDILKVANGISAEPSEGKKSAAAVIGKFAVETAADSGSIYTPSTGKIVMPGLGTADSWEELKELVNNNQDFSDAEKKKWHEKIQELQESIASVDEFISSDLYKDVMSGKIKPPSDDDLPGMVSEEEATRRADSFNNFLIAEGREPLHESIRAALIRSR